MIKCIATDMDGTLLNGRMEVSEENRKAISLAQEQGIEVVVATGRSFLEARYALQSAGIECPIICANGAEMRDAEGAMVNNACLESGQAADIYRILQKLDLYFELYTDKGTYTEDKEKALDIMVDIYLTAHTEVPADEIREAADERFKAGLIQLTDSYRRIIENRSNFVYKFIIYSYNKKILAEAEKALQQLPQLFVTSSGSENLEVTHVNAQKGIALEMFIKEKGIDWAETMAVGDNYNDISMLEKAGHSVAMGNAEAAVKAICKFETSVNDENGVAHAIYDAIKLKAEKG